MGEYTIYGSKIGSKDIVEFKDVPQNLDYARIWLLDNHPEYYFGANIIQHCENGNFLLIAVQQYYEDVYDTKDTDYILEQEKIRYTNK